MINQETEPEMLPKEEQKPTAEQVMELVQGLCGASQNWETLQILCANACRTLDGLLRDGVTPETCADAYRLAAAWMVMDWLGSSQNWAGVTALSAGDLSVRRDAASGNSTLTQRAMELMAPYVRDQEFVFQGVRG